MPNSISNNAALPQPTAYHVVGRMCAKKICQHTPQIAQDIFGGNQALFLLCTAV